MSAPCVDSGLDFLATNQGAIGVRTGKSKRLQPALRFAEHLQLCRLCEMRDECLTIALQFDMTIGIWGGTFPHERRTP